jgi:hypothetical protein
LRKSIEKTNRFGKLLDMTVYTVLYVLLNVCCLYQQKCYSELILKEELKELKELKEHQFC